MSDPSSSTDTTELKAGHAAAIKVGGMRVGASRPRQTSQGDDKEKNTSEETTTADDNEGQGENQRRANEDDEQQSGAVATHVAGEMVSGTFVPIQKAFPPEAVKNIHDKPGTHPKHDSHTHTKHADQRFINQPRKQ